MFFDLGVKGGIGVPISAAVAFQNRNRINAAAEDNSVFFRPYVLDAQCVIQTERFPETSINTDYAKQKNSQAYGELVLYLGRLRKDSNLQPFISKDDFRRDEKLGLYTFDARYQKHFFNTPIKILDLEGILLMLFQLGHFCML